MLKTIKEMLSFRKEVIEKHPKGLPYDENGQFVPDPRPVAPPVGYRREPNMYDIIREQVRRVSEELKAQGHDESFEEADDFDVDDDPELKSAYELDEEQYGMERPSDVIRQRQAKADQAKADQAKKEEKDKETSSSNAQREAPTDAKPPGGG